MNDPKHLWSGDWERHSAEPPAEPERAPAPAYSVQPPEPPAPGPSAGGWRTRRTAILGGAVLVLVIVGVALAVTLGGSKKTHQPQQQAQVQQPQPFGNTGSGSGGNSIYPTQTVPQGTTPQATTPQVAPVQTQTTATPVVGPTYSWLGTQVIASSSGVTVETIQIGGAADAAGVNPGDVITSVNNSPVGSIAQLVSATAKLKIGQQVQLTVNRGTTQVTLAATLADRPVKQP